MCNVKRMLWLVLLPTALAVALADPEPTSQPETPPELQQRVEAQRDIIVKTLDAGFEPLRQEVAHGELDWTHGRLIVAGEAQLEGQSSQDISMARRGAFVVAARNASLALAGIRVSPDGQFENVRNGNIRVDAVMQGFEVLASEVDMDRGVSTCTLVVPLWGVRGLVRVSGVRLDVPRGPRCAIGALVDPPQICDGIVIDARGLGFAPTITPALVTPQNERLFDIEFLPPDERGMRPMVIYVYVEFAEIANPQSIIGMVIGRTQQVSAQGGRLDERLREQAYEVFENPLILRADKVQLTSATTLVLTPAAVRDIVFCENSGELFRSGRVIIVTDATQPQ